MSFSKAPKNNFAFMINQKNTKINLTAILLTQIQGQNFVPSLIISYAGSIFISNFKFNFSFEVFATDYLIIITQGNLIWVDSENRYELPPF